VKKSSHICAVGRTTRSISILLMAKSKLFLPLYKLLPRDVAGITDPNIQCFLVFLRLFAPLVWSGCTALVRWILGSTERVSPDPNRRPTTPCHVAPPVASALQMTRGPTDEGSGQRCTDSSVDGSTHVQERLFSFGEGNNTLYLAQTLTLTSDFTFNRKDLNPTKHRIFSFVIT
jgi:hypothetical protein